MTYDKLTSYGSTKLVYYTQGGKTNITHFIAAETIGEKTAYIPTDFPGATAATLWDPYLLFGIKGPAALGEDEEYLLAYALEWSFDVTFRGTRVM